MTRIADIQATQDFRLDRNGYAGETYMLREDGRVMARVDGRIWALEDCGLTPDTVIEGPVWGPIDPEAVFPFRNGPLGEHGQVR